MDANTPMDVNDSVQPNDECGSSQPPQPSADEARPDTETRAIRERILHAFEARLDEILRDDAAPEGIPLDILSELKEDPPSDDLLQNDLCSMWATVTAATQEVKLQGRAFTKLRESLEPLAGIAPAMTAVQYEVREMAEVVSDAREEECARLEREVAARVQEEHLALLLDLRDRLKRGLEGSEQHLKTIRQRAKRGLFGRFFGGVNQDGLEAVEALQTGVRLAFDRLDDAVRELGVSEIDCVGQAFDPSCMRAVDVAPGGEGREGQVLKVYRPGYERNGEVLRQAEVKVARSV